MILFCHAFGKVLFKKTAFILHNLDGVRYTTEVEIWELEMLWPLFGFSLVDDHWPGGLRNLFRIKDILLCWSITWTF
jgi:hypothetical protein